MKTRSLMVALVAFSLVACGDDDGVVDGADMGMIGSDGGGGADTSTANPDSGMVDPDSGVVDTDSGMVDPDGGVIPDSGMVATDVGMMATDLGVAVDSGPPSMCMVDGNYTLTFVDGPEEICPTEPAMCTAVTGATTVAVDCGMGMLDTDCTLNDACVCNGDGLVMGFMVDYVVDFANGTATASVMGLAQCNYTLTRR